jgi:N-dimethylarginine dimethylaminohydrolase
MKPFIQGEYDLVEAGNQWLLLYKELASHGPVYLLPGHRDFQDLPFVANLGCYLPHIKNKNNIILSKFTSAPRVGEEYLGYDFFSIFDYKVTFSPVCWEGEADLKWIRNNHYLGALGSRSTQSAYRWMEDKFDMVVPTIELTDPKLYHLDCVFFPLTDNKAIVNVDALALEDIKTIEQMVEVIPVPSDCVYEGWTNIIRVGEFVLHSPFSDKWKQFEKLLDKHGFGLKIFNLAEFDKSGADLSCLVFHLNYKNRNG